MMARCIVCYMPHNTMNDKYNCLRKYRWYWELLGVNVNKELEEDKS